MLATATSRNDYIGAGNVGPFPYNFKIWAASDLKVIKRLASTGTETVLNYPADFAVTGIGKAAGGNVTLTAALSVDYKLTIKRLRPLTQSTDLRNQSTYFREDTEDALDKLMMIDQQQQDSLDRSFRLNESADPTLYDMIIAPGVAGQALGWGGNGLSFMNISAGAVVLPGNGRTVASESAYLANNAIFNILDYGFLANGVTDERNLLEAVVNGSMQGVGGGVLEIRGNVRINSNITIPTNVEIKFIKGGTLKPGAGATITINGAVNAGRYQIFDCSLGGSILFAQYNDVEANPIWFGADPNPGGADSTIPFQKWGTSAAKRLYIPWGQYDVRGTVSLATPRPVVTGALLNSTIYFNPTADNVPLFQSLNNDNIVVERVQLYGANANNRLGLVCFDFANGNVSAVTLRHVYLEHFNAIGLSLDAAQYVLLDRCRFFDHDNSANVGGTPARAIQVSTFCNSAVIRSCRFTSNDKDMRIVGVNALKIDGCSFELGGDSGLSTINHNIDIDTAGNAFSFTGNYVEGNKTGVGYAFLSVQDTKAGLVEGNVFNGSLGGITKTDIFISLAGLRSRGWTIRNNAFEEVGTFFIKTATRNVRAYDNTYTDAGVDLVTHNTVMALMSGSIELNNIQETFNVNPGAVLNGAAFVSANLAVAGAGMNDTVIISADQSLQGLTLTGWVDTAGNVKFSVANNTGGTKTFALGSWYIRILKKD